MLKDSSQQKENDSQSWNDQTLPIITLFRVRLRVGYFRCYLSYFVLFSSWVSLTTPWKKGREHKKHQQNWGWREAGGGKIWAVCNCCYKLPKWVISSESFLPPGMRLCEHLDPASKDFVYSQTTIGPGYVGTHVTQTFNYRCLWLKLELTNLGDLKNLCLLIAGSVLIASSLIAWTHFILHSNGPHSLCTMPTPSPTPLASASGDSCLLLWLPCGLSKMSIGLSGIVNSSWSQSLKQLGKKGEYVYFYPRYLDWEKGKTS